LLGAAVSRFLDEAALELREGGEDVENQLARCAGRVDGTLIERSETDNATEKICNEGDEMTHGTAQSVQPPNHENIAALQCIEALREAGRSLRAPDSLSMK